MRCFLDANLASAAGTQFTCFTGAKVQILTLRFFRRPPTYFMLAPTYDAPQAPQAAARSLAGPKKGGGASGAASNVRA